MDPQKPAPEKRRFISDTAPIYDKAIRELLGPKRKARPAPGAQEPPAPRDAENEEEKPLGEW